MFELNESQSQLVDLASKVAEESIAPHATVVDDEAAYPVESMAALASAGLNGLTVPREFGGQGANLTTTAAVVEQIAMRCPSTAMVFLMHLCGVAAYRANPDRCGDLLRASAQGEHLSTLAWSETGSRSHFWAPVSISRATAEGILLNAKKSWVTSAGYADGYVTTTGTTDGGIDLFYLSKDDPGFTVAGPWISLGMRGNASAPMDLTDVTVPEDRRLNEPGAAFGVMMQNVLPQFASGNAAISVGASEAAVRATTAHLTGKRLEHMNASLSDLPTLRARLAKMRMLTDMARAHLATTTRALDSGSSDAMLLLLSVKAVAADTALEVTDLAMRACGGAAFSKHLGVERFFRDARAMSVMAPTSDVLQEFVGRALCGMELFS